MTYAAPLAVAGLALALASCDLYFPDHRVRVAGVVRDTSGVGVAGAEVSFRRQRFLYDTPLAVTQTGPGGAYRLTHTLEGCSTLFDEFTVLAEQVVGADTTRASGEAECVDDEQTVDLVLPGL